MEDYMGLALKLAKKAQPFPNPRVGAVIVKNGKIIGKGYHRRPGTPHAEIVALQRAGNNAEGSTLYVTLEPCSHSGKRTPPCTRSIIEKGVKKVVFAMKDPNPMVNGEEELKKAGVEVAGPSKEKDARKINSRYLEHINRKPFVAIKMAMSADGRTATRTGDSKWISGKESRKEAHRMRSEFDAVMVGAGTVNSDDPKLTARIKGKKDPWRVIVDGDFCISADAKVLKNKDRKTIVATTGRAAKRKVEIIRKLAHVFVLGKNRVGMKELVQSLGAMGIKKILIEGGSELNASALEDGIVDRLYLFVAPKIIGGRNAKGVVGGKGIQRMSDAIRLKNLKTKKCGEDILLEFDIQKP
ncbi:bifunctional diaminohydroxyphosphoribosylaminopyrimidine deaminase/5-amino-6-(5-phosphoribosylamino)uracil reductase RibD [Candidatus Micrarchaeota archaeon]|nr:bifunctional diaminohydroxyphosphoribosylaminopyrimidine deaminase/5-amino-6-(5-phosphoribosylamino)uracil reductase RibD [Candidatus Micrarchaeota archaeon]